MNWSVLIPNPEMAYGIVEEIKDAVVFNDGHSISHTKRHLIQ
jgi:hypothetical protein